MTDAMTTPDVMMLPDGLARMDGMAQKGWLANPSLCLDGEAAQIDPLTGSSLYLGGLSAQYLDMAARYPDMAAAPCLSKKMLGGMAQWMAWHDKKAGGLFPLHSPKISQACGACAHSFPWMPPYLPALWEVFASLEYS